MKKLDLKLLEIICATPGAPGFEGPIRDLVIKEIKDLVDEMKVDQMGNLMAVKKGKSRKKLLIAAHLDELGFIIKHIDDDGFIRFAPLGGFDPKTLSSQRVMIHGKKEVPGVMGTKPVHKMSQAERKQVPQISDFFIDTGRRKKNVEKLVKVGDSVTRFGPLVQMGETICAKSVDNRAGVYALIEALKMLKTQKLPWDLYACFTVQEEVGLRGAKVVAHAIKPDVAIGLDTTVAYDTPGAPPQDCGTRLGEGVGIKALDSGAIGDRRMVDWLTSLCAKQKIKHQVAVVPGGANDTAALQAFAPGGTIAGSICIPTRHIHQSVEMCDKKDLIRTVDLVASVGLGVDKLPTKF